MFHRFFCTVFGLGYLPKAPGTFGSLAGFVFFLAQVQMGLLLYTITLGLLVLFLVGWLSCHHILKSTNFQNTDPHYIVIDEVVGMELALLIVYYYQSLTLFSYLVCFVLFRILDIAKPGPIGWADRFFARSSSTAALGIMLDDILAGIGAAVFTCLLSLF